MKFTYRLKRICGSVYSNGDVIFTPDGNSVLSPIGNRIVVFDLLNQSSDALPLESRKNIELVVLSHNGRFLIVVDTDGCALFFNFPRRVLLHKFNFRQRIYALEFTTDDQYFAVTYGRGCQIWKTPSASKEFSPLTLIKTFMGHYDEVTCLNWSEDSQSIILGSKDLSARVYSNVFSHRVGLSILSGHRDQIIGTFFNLHTNYAYTVASDAAVFTWAYAPPSAMIIAPENTNPSSSSDEEDEDELPELDEQTNTKNSLKITSKVSQPKGKWSLSERQLLRDQQGQVTCSSFKKSTSLLVLGFASGVFGLYEMPGCVNVHRLSVSNSPIKSCVLSPSSEWLALGIPDRGQLLVWEWKSESFILKQQGHVYGLNCMAFSSEGGLLATGGEDGHVKLWNTLSGFCTVTFKLHLAPVTGVQFIGSLGNNGKAILSCSLDGTVRAYDLLRYKNFKTLTTPSPTQFTCLASDVHGEIVCAGSLDPFQIFVWSLQTGSLIEVLSGHEGPISCLSFDPSNSSIIASGSWDGTMKIWNVYTNHCMETFEHGCDVMALTFRKDGKEVCCAATNGNLYCWDPESGEQVKLIEGRRDLAGGRLSTETSNSNKSKFFTCLDYSADGSCILAGGRSKFICIYHVESATLVKKYQLSHNRSLEGVLDKLRSDELVDGVNVNNIPIDEQEEVNAYHRISSKLPGAGRNSKLNDGSRTVKPELMASSVQFSPTGREWAAATTQGLQVFALDEDILFAPVELDMAITPQAVSMAIAEGNHVQALTMALLLASDSVLIQRAIEAVPLINIELVVRAMNVSLLRDLMRFVTTQLGGQSPLLEVYLRWVVSTLQYHGPALQQLGKSNLGMIEVLRGLLRVLQQHDKEIVRLVDENLFLLRFIESQQDENVDILQDIEKAERQVAEEAMAREGVKEVESDDEGEVGEGEWLNMLPSAWRDDEDDEDEDVIQLDGQMETEMDVDDEDSDDDDVVEQTKRKKAKKSSTAKKGSSKGK